jgi:hypothetical protein
MQTVSQGLWSRLGRSRREAAAGLSLVAFAAFALWQAADLAPGSLRRIGPGAFPLALSVQVGGCGLLLLLGSLLRDGEGIGRTRLRGSVFVLGGAVAFGMAITPLGLLVAGPLVLLIVSAATSETRWWQNVVFAALLTVFCLVLFRFTLNQPIPVAPWLIGY